MTTIVRGDAVFSVDRERTRAYYAANTLCDCSYCRNFYARIVEAYPELDAFLEPFGVEIRRPDEVAGVETERGIDYILVGYTASGVMETPGPCQLRAGPLHITVSPGDDPDAYFPHEQTGPFFFFSVSGISLPWVLPEPRPSAE